MDWWEFSFRTNLLSWFNDLQPGIYRWILLLSFNRNDVISIITGLPTGHQNQSDENVHVNIRTKDIGMCTWGRCSWRSRAPHKFYSLLVCTRLSVWMTPWWRFAWRWTAKKRRCWKNEAIHFLGSYWSVLQGFLLLRIEWGSNINTKHHWQLDSFFPHRGKLIPHRLSNSLPKRGWQDLYTCYIRNLI